jgi:hypothetical protein
LDGFALFADSDSDKLDELTLINGFNVAKGGLSPARECTGLPDENPISCKSETNIWNSNQNQ